MFPAPYDASSLAEPSVWSAMASIRADTVGATGAGNESRANNTIEYSVDADRRARSAPSEFKIIVESLLHPAFEPGVLR